MHQNSFQSKLNWMLIIIKANLAKLESCDHGILHKNVQVRLSAPQHKSKREKIVIAEAKQRDSQPSSTTSSNLLKQELTCKDQLLNGSCRSEK
jgi:hypothetical protein